MRALKIKKHGKRVAFTKFIDIDYQKKRANNDKKADITNAPNGQSLLGKGEKRSGVFDRQSQKI